MLQPKVLLWVSQTQFLSSQHRSLARQKGWSIVTRQISKEVAVWLAENLQRDQQLTLFNIEV